MKQSYVLLFMTIRKKILVAALAVILLPLMVGGGYILVKWWAGKPAGPLDAVPRNASIILSTNNAVALWDKVSGENEVWKTLKGTEALRQFDQAIAAVDSLMEVNADVNRLFSGREVVVSFHNTGSGQNDFLFVTSLQSSLDEVMMSRLLGQSSEKGEKGLRNIRAVNLEVTGKVFYYTFTNRLFIGSYSPVLITNAIEQLRSGKSLVMDETMMKLKPFTGSNVDAAIWLQFDYVPDLISAFSAKGFVPGFDKLRRFARMAALDLFIQKHKVMLSGYTLPYPTDFLRLFRNQQPQQPTALNLLPERTASFAYLCFTDFNSFVESYNNYLPETKTPDGRDSRLSLSSAQNMKESNISEIAVALVDMQKSSPAGNSLVIVRSLSPERFGQMLDETLPSSEKEKSFSINQREFKKIDFNAFFGPFLYNVFPDFDKVFYFRIGEYFLFSPVPSSLHGYLVGYLSGKTLVNTPSFKTLSEDAGERMNIWLYYSPAAAAAFHHFLFEAETAGAFDSSLPALSEFDGLSLQFSGFADLCYTSVILKHRKAKRPLTAVETVIAAQLFDTVPAIAGPGLSGLSEPSGDARFLWGMQAEHPVNGAPGIIDGLMKDRSHIAFWDEMNTVYLLGSDGKLLWNMIADGPIMGSFHVARTGSATKPCLIFNTAESLYAINIQGKTLKGYPVRLPVAAANGIALFEAGKRKELRFVFAGTDNGLYCLDANGQPLKGWTKPVLPAATSQPAKNLRAGNVDYLFLSLDNGQVYICDLNGKKAETFDISFANSTNSEFYINETNRKGAILTTDAEGKLVYMSPDGPIEKTVFDNFSKNHFFIYADFDRNGSPDFVYTDGQQMVVYDRFKKTLLAYEFKSPVAEKPFFVDVPGGNPLLVVRESVTGGIFVFDKEGLVFDSPFNGKSADYMPGIIKEGTKNARPVLMLVRGGQIEAYRLQKE
jgi:hypothetical protein